MSVKLLCPPRISRENSIPCPGQLLLIPGILRLVALSVPSLCLSHAVCSTACISLCLLLRTSMMVGRALSNNPTSSFYFKIINYLNLFMAYAKIFFSKQEYLKILCSLSNPLFQLWYFYPYLVFSVTKSLQTQVKRVFILYNSLRALPILEGKTWWQETLPEVFQRNRGQKRGRNWSWATIWYSKWHSVTHFF